MVDSIQLGFRRRGLKGSNEGQFHPLKEGTISNVVLSKACLSPQNLAQASKLEAFYIVGLLKACGIQKDLVKASKLHRYIWGHNYLEQNSEVANTLVSMYARCGALAKARQVLEELPHRDAVTWTALIAGYVQQGQGDEALKCFDSMQQDGHSPDAVTFTCALKACGSTGAIAEGEQIHEKIVSLGMLEKNAVLGSTLVDMYAKCGALAKAEQVLAELSVRDVVSWTVLIAGYAQQGQGEDALRCFDSMQCDGHPPDALTFTCALKACGSIAALAQGEQIHEKLAMMDMLEKNIVLGSTLVDMYVRCGALTKARQVLEELPVRNLVMWNALIAGYVQQGQAEQALKCFDSMQHDGHSPDVGTFTYALKACGNLGAAAKGEWIHGKIVSWEMLDKNIVLANALIDMYVRCSALSKARQVLMELPCRNVVMWTALIAGYTEQGQGDEALKCYKSMQLDGYSPDAFTFTCALKACGAIGAAAKGEQIHSRIVSLGMLQKSIVLGSALVDMYARCGEFAKAQQVLTTLPVRDVVSWTALVTGYTQHGKGEEALKCFDSMQRDGHSPDLFTYTCALKACGIIGAAAKGKQIHDTIVRLGMLNKDILLRSNLIDMYARCGELTKAKEVFGQLPVWDMVSWTTLIAGYALQGQSVEAVNCFEKMESMGVKPNSTTLICVLNACSHSGLSDMAETFFSKLSRKYGIKPDLDHYCCMVDLFGRAGKFDKALNVIKEMPSADYFTVWVALLGACQKWVDVKIGRFAFKHAYYLDRSNAAMYVCMANIYKAAGMQKDADEIEAMRVANKAWKMPI